MLRPDPSVSPGTLPPNGVTVLTGIAGTGKTAALLDRYREALRTARQQQRPGNALWLAPTNRAREFIRQQLLDATLPVVLRPNLLTFDQFADEVLRSAPTTIIPCPPVLQRSLLRRIVDDLAASGKLQHFQRISRTAGFLDLVSGFIAELKRSETWPEVFTRACSQRGRRSADREFALIYERYQAALLAANVYDGEGRFWSAQALLADGHWGQFAPLSVAVLDGFSDFTAAQFKILELLARKVDHLCISLQTGAHDARRDLFAKSQGVLQRLREFTSVTVQEFPPDSAVRGTPSVAPRPAGLAHLARHLFQNPRAITRSDVADGVEVVGVAGQINEVRYLAGRVKRLLLAGVAPADIIVAVRDLDDYAPLFEEFFTAAGLPLACEAGAIASQLPPARTLLNLLALEVEDWPFARLMNLLDSGYFRPQWEEFAGRTAARDVSALLRQEQLAEGREGMLTALERLSQLSLPAEESESVQRARQLLVRLSESLAPLRRTHQLARWSQVLDTLLKNIGLDVAPLDAPPGNPGQTLGPFLARLLEQAARAEQMAGIPQVRRGLGEFLPELIDLLEHQQLPPLQSEIGRVRVLSAEQVRSLDVPYLFLAGLSETSFPRQRGEDCLYGERDRLELNHHGLALGDRTLRGQEELLMFYGIVTRAGRQLLLTWPLVSDEGQPQSCSPYLSAILDLFAAGVLRVQLEEQLDPIPAPERLLSAADCRVRGMADALQGRPELFRAVCEEQAAARHCLAAVHMHVQRFQQPGFTNYEGWLENPRIIELIRERFSTSHEFSATQLEAYAACPFRFLLQHVLQLETPPLPGVETDHAQRGSLVHELLAEVHRRLNQEADGADTGANSGGAIPHGDAVATLFRELLDRKATIRSAAGSVQHALERIEHRLLSDWAEAYGRQWQDYVASLPRNAQQPPLPRLFEAVFGKARAAPGDPDSEAGGTRTYPPLHFGSEKSQVRLGGRIDRIDVGQVDGTAVFTIIDYKTGLLRKNSIDTLDTGRTLQLALYALAVSRLEMAGAAARPWQMGYWQIRETGFLGDGKPRGWKPGDLLPPIDDKTWTARIATLEDQVVKLAAGIRAGRFPVHNLDEHCTSMCPYGTICRVAQIRPLEQKYQLQGKHSEPVQFKPE